MEWFTRPKVRVILGVDVNTNEIVAIKRMSIR